MSPRNLLLIATFMAIPGLTTLSGQSAVIPAGGDTSGPGGTVGYSIGQVVYSNFDDISGKVNEGVQQPFEIFTVSTGEPTINLKAVIFPNPTESSVRLSMDERDLLSAGHEYSYLLFDLQGKVLRHNEIVEPTTIISLEKLAGSIYFLRVSFANKELKTFKIVKTN